MSNLSRLKKLPGSKASGKKPTESELGALVKALQNIALSQQQSQTDTTAAIQQLSRIVMAATKDGFDVEKIIEAINNLKEKMAAKEAVTIPFDYKIEFERDAVGRLKTGIELNAVARKLN